MKQVSISRLLQIGTCMLGLSLSLLSQTSFAASVASRLSNIDQDAPAQLQSALSSNYIHIVNSTSQPVYCDIDFYTADGKLDGNSISMWAVNNSASRDLDLMHDAYALIRFHQQRSTIQYDPNGKVYYVTSGTAYQQGVFRGSLTLTNTLLPGSTVPVVIASKTQ